MAAAACRRAALRVTTSASAARSASAPRTAIAVPRTLRFFTDCLRRDARESIGLIAWAPSAGRRSLCALDALGSAIEALLPGLPALRDVLQRGEHDGPEPRHLRVVGPQRARPCGRHG